MKRCPITYDPISDSERYSVRGLAMLSRQLKDILPLPFTAEEQRIEASLRAGKMSVQGMQPKLSAVLKIKECNFEVVDSNGKFILKPQCDFPEVPQNEALTMTLAQTVGIEVPLHGLLYSKDGSFTYFIKRFDRTGRHDKIAVEDFAQLSGKSRETKYDSSMEKVAGVVKDHCTFPVPEYAELFKRVIFDFLTGNEDMHLKNFSLIDDDDVIKIAPAYDLLNSTIALQGTRDELALPLNGKKSKLKQEDFVDYFAVERLGLGSNMIDRILKQFEKAIPEWFELISISFLSDDMKKSYTEVLSSRIKTLKLQ